jgi:hypothetical protein
VKYFILVTIMFLSTFSFAETVQLPDTKVNQEVLGGDILLIKMKGYLMISGKESQALEKELGIDSKKKFKRDIVMAKSFAELVALYNPVMDKKMVQVILNRYSDVLAKIDSKSSLN